MCLGEKPRRKNTQYGDLNPYPPSGTLVARPLNPHRVSVKDMIIHCFLTSCVWCLFSWLFIYTTKIHWHKGGPLSLNWWSGLIQWFIVAMNSSEPDYLLCETSPWFLQARVWFVHSRVPFNKKCSPIKGGRGLLGIGLPESQKACVRTHKQICTVPQINSPY